MNYFKLIKAALDVSLGPICRHKNISVDQAPQAVKHHLGEMIFAYFFAHRSECQPLRDRDPRIV